MASHDNASASATADWPLTLIKNEVDRKAKPETIGSDPDPLLTIWTAALLGQGSAGTVVAGLLGDQKVAVKLLRSVFTQTEKTALNTEVLRWSGLDHPRVLRFLRQYDLQVGQVALVSPYMKNGNLFDFITKKAIPMESRLELLKQVAEGLNYLHTTGGTIHGDLKCTNILVSADQTALIGDFGLSTVLTKFESDKLTLTNIRIRNTAQYAAPELFTDEAVQPSADTGNLIKRSKTAYSDVYAFGMLIYEVVTGVAPWNDLSANDIRREVVTEGKRPPRTEQFSDDLWELCGGCWAQTYSDRPNIAQVLAEITRLAPAAH